MSACPLALLYFFIHLSVTGRSAHKGDRGIYVQGKTLRGDKPLLAAEAPWLRLHDNNLSIAYTVLVKDASIIGISVELLVSIAIVHPIPSTTW